MQISLMLLGFVILLCIMFSVFRLRVNKVIFILLWFCLVCCISYTAYHFQLQDSSWQLDLFRYYGEINSYREMSNRELINSIRFSAEPGRTILFGFVSRLPSNQFLPFISCALVYTLIGYFIYDAGIGKNDKISFYFLLPSMIAVTAMIFYSDVILTLRCVISYGIICFSYVKFVKNRKYLPVFILLGVLAGMLHNTGYFVIVILMVYTVYPRLFRYRWFLVIWRLALLPVAYLLQQSNIFIIYKLGVKIAAYTSNIYRHYLYWGCMAVLLLLIQGGVEYLLKRKNKIQLANRKEIEVMSLFVILSLGGIINIAGIRLMFIVAFLFPYFARELATNLRRDKRLVWFIGFAGSSCGLIIYNLLYFLLQSNRAGAYWG